jgi:hypothetical protein
MAHKQQRKWPTEINTETNELTVNTVNALTIPFCRPPHGFKEERITSIGKGIFLYVFTKTKRPTSGTKTQSHPLCSK